MILILLLLLLSVLLLFLLLSCCESVLRIAVASNDRKVSLLWSVVTPGTALVVLCKTFLLVGLVIASSVVVSIVIPFAVIDTSVCCSPWSEETSASDEIIGSPLMLSLLLLSTRSVLCDVANTPCESTVDDGTNPNSKRK